MKYHFRACGQVTPLIWNMLANSNRGLEYAAKFRLRLLSDNQKQWCVSTCQELLNEVRIDQNFLLRVITGDKT
jgi:hypothetical protein